MTEPKELNYDELIRPADTSTDAGGNDNDAGSDDGQRDDQEGDEGTDQGNVGDEGAGSGDGAKPDADADYRKDLQARLSARYGENVKVPEGLTRDQELEFIERLAYSRLHPEAVAMNQALVAGKKPEEYLKELSFFDDRIRMDDADLIKAVYRDQWGKSEKRPDGWDDEKIAATVQKMDDNGTLAIEAEKARDAYRESKSKRQEQAERFAAGSKAPDFADPKVLEAYGKNIEAGMRSVLKETNGSLFGLDFGKPENQDRLVAKVQHLLKPDPKTGQTQWDLSMSKNNEFLKAVVLYDMYQTGALERALASKSAETKRRILEGLDDKPSSSGGVKPKPGQLDFSRLTRPAETYTPK